MLSLHWNDLKPVAQGPEAEYVGDVDHAVERTEQEH